MFKYIIIVLLLSVSWLSHSEEVKDVIKLDMEIRLNDGRFFEPTLTVISQKEAILTFDAVANENNSIQARVKASSIDEDIFDIKAQILELDGQRWSILNEVSAVGYYDNTLTLDVGGFAELKVVGTLSDTSNKLVDCDLSVQSDGGAIGIGDDNCCVADCQDGSGYQLRCCNVVQCSGCGTQCSP